MNRIAGFIKKYLNDLFGFSEFEEYYTYEEKIYQIICPSELRGFCGYIIDEDNNVSEVIDLIGDERYSTADILDMLASPFYGLSDIFDIIVATGCNRTPDRHSRENRPLKKGIQTDGK